MHGQARRVHDPRSPAGGTEMADAAIHGHEHEDDRGFFTRWFMSTNHKDIGILYLITAAIVGFIAVAFTVYMRLELMEPGVQYMCMEGARFTRRRGGELHAQRAPVERADHRPRHPDDVLRGHSRALRRVRQLLHALADRRAGHGVPADEQPQLLALRRGHALAICSVLAPGGNGQLGSGVGWVLYPPLSVNEAACRRISPSSPCTSRAPPRSSARSTSSPHS